jgi:EAL domain-containing protein (putative c-di-GMP-specific phosphodiesterase class I)
MMENEENLAIVRTIVALAQNLGMDVVAEGVETEDQLALLRKLECENGQGFLFSVPLNARQLDQFIANHILEAELAVGPVQIFDNPAALVA